jgi:histone-lysine N-methyltransferase SETMAR
MVTVFWDCDEVILVDVMPRGATINSEAYINTLNKLKKRLRRVRLGKNPAQMLLRHDNARPHTSLRTREHINKMGWTVLPHPPYSPDLPPSDFHLFGSRNSLWRWQQHNWSSEEVATQAGQELVPARNTCTCSTLACKRNIHLYCHQISTILNKYILRKKNVGQNFLNNINIKAKII